MLMSVLNFTTLLYQHKFEYVDENVMKSDLEKQ